MDTPSPSLRQLARRLLALEAAAPPAADADRPHEAIRVCNKLQASLTRFAGAEGFAALLRRALALAGADVPALRRAAGKPDGALAALEALAREGPEVAHDAGAALTTRLLALLVTFIGESLTLQLLRDAWPGAELELQQHESRQHK